MHRPARRQPDERRDRPGETRPAHRVRRAVGGSVRNRAASAPRTFCSTSGARRAAEDPSTIALVELVSGLANYQFSLGADFQWQAAELAFLPGGAQAAHFGSLASWLPPGDAAVAVAVDGLRRAGSVLISYDPNVRPALQPDTAAARRQIEQSVSLAHVVKASRDDLAWLYGPDTRTRSPGLSRPSCQPVVIPLLRRPAQLVGREATNRLAPAFGSRWSTQLAPVTRSPAGCSTRSARRDLLAPAGIAPSVMPRSWPACSTTPAGSLVSPVVGQEPTRPPGLTGGSIAERRRSSCPASVIPWTGNYLL